MPCADIVVLVEVTVTNDIPKCYSRELSMTNDIFLKCDTTYICTYALAELSNVLGNECKYEGKRVKGYSFDANV